MLTVATSIFPILDTSDLNARVRGAANDPKAREDIARYFHDHLNEINYQLNTTRYYRNAPQPPSQWLGYTKRELLAILGRFTRAELLQVLPLLPKSARKTRMLDALRVLLLAELAEHLEQLRPTPPAPDIEVVFLDPLTFDGLKLSSLRGLQFARAELTLGLLGEIEQTLSLTAASYAVKVYHEQYPSLAFLIPALARYRAGTIDPYLAERWLNIKISWGGELSLIGDPNVGGWDIEVEYAAIPSPPRKRTKHRRKAKR